MRVFHTVFIASLIAICTIPTIINVINFPGGWTCVVSDLCSPILCYASGGKGALNGTLWTGPLRGPNAPGSLKAVNKKDNEEKDDASPKNNNQLPNNICSAIFFNNANFQESDVACFNEMMDFVPKTTAVFGAYYGLQDNCAVYEKPSNRVLINESNCVYNDVVMCIASVTSTTTTTSSRANTETRFAQLTVSSTTTTSTETTFDTDSLTVTVTSYSFTTTATIDTSYTTFTTFTNDGCSLLPSTVTYSTCTQSTIVASQTRYVVMTDEVSRAEAYCACERLGGSVANPPDSLLPAISLMMSRCIGRYEVAWIDAPELGPCFALTSPVLWSSVNKIRHSCFAKLPAICAIPLAGKTNRHNVVQEKARRVNQQATCNDGTYAVVATQVDYAQAVSLCQTQLGMNLVNWDATAPNRINGLAGGCGITDPSFYWVLAYSSIAPNTCMAVQIDATTSAYGPATDAFCTNLGYVACANTQTTGISPSTDEWVRSTQTSTEVRVFTPLTTTYRETSTTTITISTETTLLTPQEETVPGDETTSTEFDTLTSTTITRTQVPVCGGGICSSCG